MSKTKSVRGISFTNQILISIAAILAFSYVAVEMELVFLAIVVSSLTAIFVLCRVKKNRDSIFALHGITTEAIILDTKPVSEGLHVCKYLLRLQVLLPDGSSYETGIYVQFNTDYNNYYNTGGRVVVRIDPRNPNKLKVLCLLHTDPPQDETVLKEIIAVAESNETLKLIGEKHKATMKWARKHEFKLAGAEMYSFGFVHKKTKTNIELTDIIPIKAKNSYFFRHNNEPILMGGEDGDVPVVYRLLRDKNTGRYILHKRKNGKRKLDYRVLIFSLIFVLAFCQLPIMLKFFYTGFANSKLATVTWIPGQKPEGEIWELRFREIEDSEDYSFIRYEVFVSVYDPIKGKKTRREKVIIDNKINLNFDTYYNDSALCFYSYTTSYISTSNTWRYDTLNCVLCFSRHGHSGGEILDELPNNLHYANSMYKKSELKAFNNLVQNKKAYVLVQVNDNKKALYSLVLDSLINENLMHYYYGESIFEYCSTGNFDYFESIGCSVEKVYPEKEFIFPVIVYQDSCIVAVLHKESIAKDSHLRLSSFHRDGNKWSVDVSELFNKEKKNHSSNAAEYPYQTNTKAIHHKNMLIVIIDDLGILSLDYHSGECNWVFAAKTKV